MNFRITVRYGGSRQRYHTYSVEADDARSALEKAARDMPDEIVPQADLVELRIAVDPADRAFIE